MGLTDLDCQLLVRYLASKHSLADLDAVLSSARSFRSHELPPHQMPSPRAVDSDYSLSLSYLPRQASGLSRAKVWEYRTLEDNFPGCSACPGSEYARSLVMKSAKPLHSPNRDARRPAEAAWDSSRPATHHGARALPQLPLSKPGPLVPHPPASRVRSAESGLRPRRAGSGVCELTGVRNVATSESSAAKPLLEHERGASGKQVALFQGEKPHAGVTRGDATREWISTGGPEQLLVRMGGKAEERGEEGLQHKPSVDEEYLSRAYWRREGGDTRAATVRPSASCDFGDASNGKPKSPPSLDAVRSSSPVSVTGGGLSVVDLRAGPSRARGPSSGSPPQLPRGLSAASCPVVSTAEAAVSPQAAVSRLHRQDHRGIFSSGFQSMAAPDGSSQHTAGGTLLGDNLKGWLQVCRIPLVRDPAGADRSSAFRRTLSCNGAQHARDSNSGGTVDLCRSASGESFGHNRPRTSEQARSRVGRPASLALSDAVTAMERKTANLTTSVKGREAFSGWDSWCGQSPRNGPMSPRHGQFSPPRM